jgi:pimeloyl-ACP methyl ester carboxylesterase
LPKEKVNDIGMYYEIIDFTNPWEEPETLVLIHGYIFNAKFWFPQVPAFCKEFRVVTVDNRGYGRTTIPQKGFTIKTMANDIKVLLDKLKIDKAYVLGHCSGGCITQQFALDYPEKVKGLVLFATFSQPLDPPLDWNSLKQMLTAANLIDVAEQSAPMAFSSKVHKNLLEWVRTEIKNVAQPYVGERSKVMLDFSESLFTINLTDQLKNIEAQTLVIVGEDDTTTPPKFSKIIHRNIPKSEFVSMSGLHYCSLEYPSEFNKIVLKFLRKLRSSNQKKKRQGHKELVEFGRNISLR